MVQFDVASSTWGFIGAGKMAEAIIRGIISRNIVQAENVYISDPSAERTSMLKSDLNVNVVNNVELANSCQVIVLAVKPNISPIVLEEIAKHYTNQIVISVMAGKPIKFIQSFLGEQSRVIRTMPNTPALCGQGMIALAPSPQVEEEVVRMAEKVFSSIGKALVTKEEKLDVITALSGSGPAYVFYFCECLIKGAQAHGLSETEAALLAKQTFLGAATLMDESDLTPEQLRINVCSPGGTTLAGLSQLIEGDLEKVSNNVINAAKTRSEELSQ
eukprot:GCRY01000206.1.p1 GENE.GCRY01000206.1~~GCRY01000206.1.p1  ORF type:complete len:273 (-),score=77.30 GCRY01000206.1:167-985(-)